MVVDVGEVGKRRWKVGSGEAGGGDSGGSDGEIAGAVDGWRRDLKSRTHGVCGPLAV